MNDNKPKKSIFELGFHIFDKWLKLRLENKTLFDFFEDNYINSVAIYGMGALGERLFDELNGLDVEVKYAIDRMAAVKQYSSIKIYGTDEVRYPEVDAVIVTPILDYWNIVELLKSKTDAPVLSIEDVVEYVWNKNIG